MSAELVCFNPGCPERFPIDAVLYECPHCGGLLEARYDFAPLKPPRSPPCGMAAASAENRSM